MYKTILLALGISFLGSANLLNSETSNSAPHSAKKQAVSAHELVFDDSSIYETRKESIEITEADLVSEKIKITLKTKSRDSTIYLDPKELPHVYFGDTVRGASCMEVCLFFVKSVGENI